jgi:hypothetical protein
MKRAGLVLGCVVFLYGSLPTFSSTAQAGAGAVASSRAVKAEAYAGTIVSLNGERFILRDDDNELWYHLDDQQQASKFAGKKVLVEGQLDASTNVIHVQQIEEAGK